VKKNANDFALEHDLRRLSADLNLKYGVVRVGYFYDFTIKNSVQPVEVNIIVELARPMGWKFFELKEYLQKKLYRRVDLITPNGLKVIFKNEIMPSVKWL
jgi:predicted nucleotidyltransferase